MARDQAPPQRAPAPGPAPAPAPRSATIFERFPALKRLGRERAAKARIPFVQQLTETECGAASLAMVLGFFGKEVGLEQVRDVCGGSRDGVNALTLLAAGRHFNLAGRGLKVQPDKLHLLVPGATILHWEFSHFVVFAGCTRDGVRIMDPGAGERVVSDEELSRCFTGVALEFRPTDLFTAERRPGILYATMKRLVLESGLLRPILVLSLVLQLFGMALPMLTGQLVDTILPRAEVSLLWGLLLGMLVLVLFDGLGEFLRGSLLLQLRTVLDVRLTLGFLDHMVRLPYPYFQQRSAGDLMMRLNSSEEVRDHVTASALTGILDGLLVVVYLGVLVLGDMGMAAAAIGFATAEALIFLGTRKRLAQLAAEGLQAEARSQGYEVEMLTAMETLKATGAEHRAVSHWSDLFVNNLNVDIRRERLSLRVEALLGAVRGAAPLLILGVGAMSVLQDRLGLGAMLALSAVAGGFLEPTSRLIRTAMSIDLVRVYLERMNDVLEAPLEQGPRPRSPAPRLTGQIDLEGVSFSYAPDSPKVVKEVSLHIPPGRFVAVVGRSGSGKSTLAKLMLGLYQPSAGIIRFDGINLDDMDLPSVRRQMGIVNQNLALFGGTIRENISLTDPALPLSQVEEAAELAAIAEDIEAMPLGYSTPLTDQGASLSGGQKQRLALARALVGRPALLLLDEATSALDAVTERRVQEALDRLPCTRIVIAHRLSTVMRADVILVMEDGRIVERGDHQSLLARGGPYCRLVAAQLGEEFEEEGADEEEEEGEEEEEEEEEEEGAEEELDEYDLEEDPPAGEPIGSAETQPAGRTPGTRPNDPRRPLW